MALATSRAWPALAADDRPLVDALRAAGVWAEPAVWDDPAVDWSAYAAVLVRSCWDYHLRPADFEAWIAAVGAAGASLLNPAPALRWNLRKSYLAELAEGGADVVPTQEVGDAAAVDAALAACAARGWRAVVVKPVVGASSHETWRATLPLTDHERRRLAAEVVMAPRILQPFVPEVATRGEVSLVFLDGAFSHAVLKRPARGDFRVQEELGGSSTRVAAPTVWVESATALLDRLAWDLAYARVDAVPVKDRLLLMELELIEPVLFLGHAPGAHERLAAAVARRLR